MKTISSLCFLPALVAGALLTGCYTGDPYPGHHGAYEPDHHPYDQNEQNDQRDGDVRGTVKRVDPRNHLVVLQAEGADRDRGREVIFYYDDDTKVEYQGETYGGENLEPGDQIEANLERGRDGLIAQQIQVLHDASSGDGRQGPDNRNHPGDMNPRGDRDHQGGYDSQDVELRGVIRRADARDHTLEIDRSGDDSDSGEPSDRSTRSGVVVVHYDQDTVVETDGHTAAPESLGQGDVVEIQLRGNGRAMIADRIVVVGEGRSRSRSR